MANVLEEKILKSVKWIVRLSNLGNITEISKDFSFQGHQCKLVFYNGSKRSQIPAFLIILCRQALQLPVTVEISVALNEEPLDHMTKSIICVNEAIWTYSKECSITSSILTFKVIFETDCYIEDKCVQTASYMNPNISEQTLAEDFSKLLNNGLDYDVEMKCSGETVKVHKLVLSARSDVFKAMLQNDMLEGQTGVVEIKDMDVNYFRDFVKYLYSDVMPELCFDKAKALYEVGDKYAVKSLVVRCSEYLQENLSLDNIFECYAVADAHSDEKLKEILKAYILEKQVYLQDEYWLPFHESFPKVALEVYRVFVKEIRANK